MKQNALRIFLKNVWVMLAGVAVMLSAQAGAAEFVVKVKNNFVLQQFAQSLGTTVGAQVIDQHPDGRLLLVSANDKSGHTILTRIRKLAEVEYAVENIKLYALEAPDDPHYSKQWALQKVNAEAAWGRQRGSHDVVVAVIDTGIAWNHEDLSENIWINEGEIAGNGVDDDGNGFKDDVRGWDFRDNDNNPDDLTSDRNPGHGTHCAGIVGAIGNNGVGISGIAQSVRLMPVRFLGADGSGDLMSGAKAIDYAVKNNADIISASWGAKVSRSQVAPILEAIQRAEQKGVVFVAAAANDGANNDTTEMYPANAGFDNVITVAASDSSDGKPSWSNYGKAKVSIAAPGLNIFSTLPGDTYKNLSGTSMATPLVAGAVALIKSQAAVDGRDLSPLEIKAILQSTGAQVEIETACQCRIDVAAALTSVSERSLTVVPNALTLAPSETKTFSGTGGDEPYTFTSTNPQVATIDSNGTLTAVANGETTVTIKDASDATASSKTIFVGTSSGGGGGQCPFGPLCDILCQIDPSFPWCQ